MSDTEQVMKNNAQNPAPQDSEIKQLDVGGLHCFNTNRDSNTLCVETVGKNEQWEKQQISLCVV